MHADLSTQHRHSNSMKQPTARFWTNAQSIHFLLRHVFSVEKRVCMRRKHYLMTVLLHSNALRWEGADRLQRQTIYFKRHSVSFWFVFPEIDCKKGNTDICLGDWHIMWQFCKEHNPSLVPPHSQLSSPELHTAVDFHGSVWLIWLYSIKQKEQLEQRGKEIAHKKLGYNNPQELRETKKRRRVQY